MSLASQENRVAFFLLRATTDELERAQDHISLMSKSTKCRVATFLTDLWVRLGRPEYLDVPMSHQDIADHLCLTIETVSRAISDLERSPRMNGMRGYLDAQRKPATVTIMTSTVMSITSIEPSPSSGEKPKCRSIKSMGAALLRCTQSSTAPQTAMIEPKPISTPRAVGSTARAVFCIGNFAGR